MNTPKKRPFGVTILAIVAVLAGLVQAYTALQYFGILPLSLGPLQFFGTNLVGGLFAVLLALIWFWVARMLWRVNAQGWLFVVALSVINLAFAVLAILGASTVSALLPALLVNGLALIYSLLPGTKAAFGQN